MSIWHDYYFYVLYFIADRAYDKGLIQLTFLEEHVGL